MQTKESVSFPGLSMGYNCDLIGLLWDMTAMKYFGGHQAN